MSRMTVTTSPVTGGVDTHSQTHHAAVIDQLGQPLSDREFPATPAGYRGLLGLVVPAFNHRRRRGNEPAHRGA